MLKSPDAADDKENILARLRVSRQASQKKGISPDYTHIIIRVDLSLSAPMQVDLSATQGLLEAHTNRKLNFLQMHYIVKMLT